MQEQEQEQAQEVLGAYIACVIDTSVPLDLVIQVLRSGDRIAVTSEQEASTRCAEEGLTFWLYGDECIGVADILLVTPGESDDPPLAWVGPMRALDAHERRVFEDRPVAMLRAELAAFEAGGNDDLSRGERKP